MPVLTPTRRKLLGNVSWLYALQGLNYLVPLAVLPYLIRVLGVERYGLIAFAQSFAQYFVILTDYGFNLSATRHIARMQHDRESVSRHFWAVMFIKVAMMIAGAVVMGVVVAAVPRFRVDGLLYAIAYISVVGSVFFPVWLFQGMEQMRYISFLTGGAKMGSALLLFIFVHRPSDYVVALAIQSGGLLLAGIAGFALALTNFKIANRLPSSTELSETLRDGWHLFVSNAATMAYTNSNVFLVGIFAGNVQAGYFSGAEKIIRGIQGLLAPITQAFFPHISALVRDSRDRALLFLRKSLIWIGILSFVPSAMLFLLAAPVSRVVFGAGFLACIPVLRSVAILPFVIAVSSVLAIQTMIPLQLEKLLSRIYIVAGLASLALSIPLIRQLGATGAGISVSIIEVFVVLAMWTVLHRHGVNLLKPNPPAAAIARPELEAKA